jgi:iron complex outermembrane receptor protein
VPTSVIDSYNNGSTRSRTITAGNLALRPEKADTYSVGAVLAPVHAGPLFRRFTLSVDYYNIKISDAIGNISGPIAVQRCFNADGSNPTYDNNNEFCRFISREASTGQIGSILNPRLNLGGYRTAGIDIAALWPIPLPELGLPGGTVSLGTDVSYLDKFEIQTLPGAPFLDYAGTIQNTQIDLFSSARPRWKATSSVRYADDTYELGFRWRYIGPMDNSGNVGLATPTLPHTASVSYFDIDLAARVGRRFELRGGVTNLFDRAPPITVLSPVGQYTVDLNTYDIIGRRLFIGFRATL